MKRIITAELISNFKNHLINEEKSMSTITKYIHDVEELAKWFSDVEIEKSDILAYKTFLNEHYAPASVNSALSSINSFFAYSEWFELRVKSVKIQKQIFASTDKELTKEEYERLLAAAKAKKNERLYLLMQTICSTGIRVSELRYITVEAVNCGRAEIRCKGKHRTVFIPTQLCKILKKYITEQKIKSGSVFVTKNGNPLDRSNIWSDMKNSASRRGCRRKKYFLTTFAIFLRAPITAYKKISFVFPISWDTVV